ncbi:DUF58 domain-containing protein [Pilimelia columellifera]|uniref:DUF58 domain-containing protein n=1 Tax=Pilimelia columellifera subsp. columellifera TaxID=706583 RepID=A0ABN3NIT9_9ACTN
MSVDPLGRGHLTLARLRLLVTRRLDGLLQGEYVGLLPGPGAEAGESREYRPGDDVRRMDWHVTARTTIPHVRETIADRELETWLAVDRSASLEFGSAAMLKRDLAVAAAAAVVHLAARGGNRVGAVVGAGPADARVLPARSGRRAAQALTTAIARQPGVAGPGDLPGLIGRLARPPRRRGLAVVISDFLGSPSGWARPMRALATRHDVLAVEVSDPRERELPDVGVLTVVDPETGRWHEARTTAALRRRYAQDAAERADATAAALRLAGVGLLRLSTDRDWLRDIVAFVAARRHARARGAV